MSLRYFHLKLTISTRGAKEWDRTYTHKTCNSKRNAASIILTRICRTGILNCKSKTLNHSPFSQWTTNRKNGKYLAKNMFLAIFLKLENCNGFNQSPLCICNSSETCHAHICMYYHWYQRGYRNHHFDSGFVYWTLNEKCSTVHHFVHSNRTEKSWNNLFHFEVKYQKSFPFLSATRMNTISHPSKHICKDLSGNWKWSPTLGTSISGESCHTTAGKSTGTNWSTGATILTGICSTCILDCMWKKLK